MAELRVESRDGAVYVGLEVRTTMPDIPAKVGPAFDEVAAYLSHRGEVGVGAEVIRYRRVALDAPFAIDVGLTVDVAPAGRDRYVVRELTAGRYAVAEQRGPYSTIGALTKELMDWCDAEGHEVAMTLGEDGAPDEFACWYELYPSAPVEGPLGMEGPVQVCLLLRD